MHPVFDSAKHMLAHADDQLKQYEARNAVQMSPDDASSGLHCVVCESAITAPPYWCCLGCTSKDILLKDRSGHEELISWSL